MLVIHRIQFIEASGDSIEESFMFLQNYVSPLCSLCLELLDTITGEVKYVRGTSVDGVKELFGEDIPYGFAELKGSKNSGSLFIAVDTLSLQFLECVKCVTRQIIKYSDPLAKRLCPHPEVLNLMPSFCDVDVEMSLFSCKPSTVMSSCGCTLLHAVDYVKDGWHDNDFYLFFKYLPDLGGVPAVAAYKVEFQDISRARTILGKLAYSGGNTIESYEHLLRGKV